MTADTAVDVLMITYNAPGYVKLSLPRVLESLGENDRVWLWQNGDDEEMLEVAHHFAKDDRVHRFHHSHENVRLTEPTNWVWTEGSATFVSKVDDDCLLPVDWITRLRDAHLAVPDADFGAIGSARLRDEDRVPKLIKKKVVDYGSGVQLLRNHWVQGSGYLMPRRWVEQRGLLQDGESWTNYCLALAREGAINGFLYPIIFEDHMDDPRSEHTLLHTDEDLAWRSPLSMKRNKIVTLADWEARMRRSALGIQKASHDIRQYEGWRLRRKNLLDKIARARRP